MSDTRPPEQARVPAVEELRLQLARAEPQTEQEGELKSTAMTLLECLDHVLTVHNDMCCCTAVLTLIVEQA
jgi:hypothetical protein